MWSCGLVNVVVLAPEWLVRPQFVAKNTWFGKLDFCNTEEERATHGVKDHEVRDGNEV